ncbi:MAG: CRISPR-associated endonuclease Cas3'', partial [Clostridia bacterium]|nr:CRISPR-associated endonuclease Cas3'' [Clostridia bacterium]
MQKIYYAKSERSDGSKPTVTEHLDAVSRWAAKYGEDAGVSEQARIAGLMHDFGKYSDAFQGVLCGLHQNVDHASCGATALLKIWNKETNAYRAAIEAVNGHHAGLASLGSISELLSHSFKGTRQITINGGRTPALSGVAEYQQAMNCFRADHPEERFVLPRWTLPENAGNIETMLYTRMVFSCLVDADYSVSAMEDNCDYSADTDAPALDVRDCLRRLYAYRDAIRKSSAANDDVGEIRNQVFEQCGEFGERKSGGLFTLTAPTGTGKTLALLHFALRHALSSEKRRIIIVLPFLTLAEQTADVYGRIMPSVLIDHSQSRLGEEMRDFTAKWNMPFIITTSVKFFETLFAHNPSDCRKLHNLARSVVIFDEAQSLPPHLTVATLKAVNELCARYQMSMVFSTATQPSFDAIPDLSWMPQEILPDGDSLYNRLRRVEVDWRLEGRVPLEDIAQEMQTHESVCGIFNIRKHARTVFERMCEHDSDSSFLISTDLCPAHRIRVVEEIRSR